jgi:hypothetical protein
MKQLELYLGVFNVKLNEFLTIAFEETEKIVLITKKDMTRIKFELKDHLDHWDILRKNLPNELEFIGFQHSEEDNSFSAYTVIERRIDNESSC